MVTAVPVSAPGWPGLPVLLELRPVPIARRLLAGSSERSRQGTMGDMSPGARESCTLIRNARVEGQGLNSIVLGSNGMILAAPEGDVRTFDAAGRVVVPALVSPMPTSTVRSARGSRG